MNKAEVCRYLAEQKISFEITEHRAVSNMEEAGSLDLPYSEWEAKNLFVRDDKKQHYYLVTVRGDGRVDLKAFRQAHGLRALSFASAEELRDILDLTPGAVTPLGILNDAARRVHFYLDAAFAGHKIGIHPNDNTATVWMQADDLLALVQRHGNEAAFTAL